MKKPIGLSIATALIVLALGPAAGAVTVETQAPRTCEQRAAQMVSVAAAVIERACDALRQETRDGDRDQIVPTVFLAWPAVSTVNEDGAIVYAVSGICLYQATPSGAEQDGGEIFVKGQHVVAGSAQAIGPAASTKITCSVSPVGLSATGQLIGPAAAAANTKAGRIRPQTLCTTVSATWLVGSAPNSKTDCSPTLI